MKGTRQRVIVTHNPSGIDQNQLLTVNFPKLGSYDVIVPRRTSLTFNIELSSKEDPQRTLVTNIGRGIVKKLAVKFEGNEILGVDDFDLFAESEKQNSVRQGIICSGGCTENSMKLRINASDKDASNPKNKAIADSYGNKFIIPLDFEMLDSAVPCHQSGLRNRLCYEITFNNYNRLLGNGRQ